VFSNTFWSVLSLPDCNVIARIGFLTVSCVERVTVGYYWWTIHRLLCIRWV